MTNNHQPVVPIDAKTMWQYFDRSDWRPCPACGAITEPETLDDGTIWSMTTAHQDQCYYLAYDDCFVEFGPVLAYLN